MNKVRLLTFDSLPLPAFNAPVEPWVEAIWELTQLSTYFEDHHLQHSASALANELAPLFSAGNGASIVVGSGNIREGATQVDSLSQIDQQQADSPFVWLHRSSLTDTADWPADFADCVNAVQKLKNEGDTTLTFITALAGYCPEHPEYNSLAFDTEIRVPLWLLGSPMRASERCTTLTGTGDLVHTIALSLGQADQATDSEFEACDLRTVHEGGLPEDRQLYLHLPERSAVRTSEFLYVRTADFKSGLYAKPVDVWNVHDVSGEFHDIVDSLDAALDAPSNRLFNTADSSETG